MNTRSKNIRDILAQGNLLRLERARRKLKNYVLDNQKRSVVVIKNFKGFPRPGPVPIKAKIKKFKKKKIKMVSLAQLDEKEGEILNFEIDDNKANVLTLSRTIKNINFNIEAFNEFKKWFDRNYSSFTMLEIGDIIYDVSFNNFKSNPMFFDGKSVIPAYDLDRINFDYPDPNGYIPSKFHVITQFPVHYFDDVFKNHYVWANLSRYNMQLKKNVKVFNVNDDSYYVSFMFRGAFYGIVGFVPKKYAKMKFVKKKIIEYISQNANTLFSNRTKLPMIVKDYFLENKVENDSIIAISNDTVVQLLNKKIHPSRANDY